MLSLHGVPQNPLSKNLLPTFRTHWQQGLPKKCRSALITKQFPCLARSADHLLIPPLLVQMLPDLIAREVPRDLLPASKAQATSSSLTQFTATQVPSHPILSLVYARLSLVSVAKTPLHPPQSRLCSLELDLYCLRP